MEIDDFWSLIEQSAGESGTRRDRARWLGEQLCRRPLDDVVEFQVQVETCRQRLHTDATWAAGDLIIKWSNIETFHNFLAWVIGLGPDAYARVADDPANLAELPAVQRLADRSWRLWDDDWPEWAQLPRAARDAYDQLAGSEGGIVAAMVARGYPVGHNPPARSATLYDYPRLAAMFPPPRPVARGRIPMSIVEEFLKRRDG